ncbi:unnamed protein product [Fusarium graminearum]|uniref:Chromosome 1, complete genome n=2 Tax=Gibberella zeae TaxID=5518 RepID=A0A098D0M4_GIBZE|nr:unnamed protein product [Fusarium graminearum]CAF3579465.1 unnamed protein product [Fusarium graminearum]CAF3627534.1 unnamed protein product [Fusarium graminearum]CAG1997782.1 unnamed protein product [Fusarium graminearum]CAG2003040.1 unnamed protein product [Fusarium graminearum]
MNLGSRAMVGKERWVGYPLPEAGHVHDDTPYGDCHPHYRVTEGRSQAQAPFARDWIRSDCEREDGITRGRMYLVLDEQH